MKTRWVENHDGLLRLVDIYKAAIESLEQLQDVSNVETSSKACQLLRSITASDFIIATVTACQIFPLLYQYVKCCKWLTVI